MLFYDYVKLFVNLIAVCDPIGTIPIYLMLTEGLPAAARRKIPLTIVTVGFIVLSLSVFIGFKLLAFFGISVAAFRIAGGLLLLWIAFDMLHSRSSRTKQSPEQVEEEHENVGVVPLGIPLFAGPGAISTVLMYSNSNPTISHKFYTCIAIFVFVCFAFCVFKMADYIGQKLGKTGINIATRLMGLLLAAMGVEFILHGVGEYFSLLVK